MTQLRLVGVSDDGQHLVLADDAGVQHTITLDERLRATVNGQLSRLGKLTMALESRLSPREIQDRVRGGESADHVAVTAGVPLERVLRFVGPVLREREHVVEQARRARLAGSGGPTLLLADVVARAATRQGVEADDVSWDSARREDHSWVVSVTWPDGTSATWGLDLARHQATPADALARRVSGTADDSSSRSIDLDAEAAIGGELELDRDDDRNVRLFVPRAVPPTEPDTDEPGLKPDVGASDAGEFDADEFDAGDFTETAPVGPLPPVDERSTSGESRPARPTRRARVPKWDDIMFGPKSKD